MLKACDLRQKEVINVTTAERLGYVCDVEIDFNTGSIASIIVPGKPKILGVIGKKEDYVIPWDKIVRVGDDVVLVEVRELIYNQ